MSSKEFTEEAQKASIKTLGQRGIVSFKPYANTVVKIDLNNFSSAAVLECNNPEKRVLQIFGANGALIGDGYVLYERNAEFILNIITSSFWHDILPTQNMRTIK